MPKVKFLTSTLRRVLLFNMMMCLILVSCETEKDFVQDDQMIVKRCSMNDFRLQSNEKLMKAVSQLNGFIPKKQLNDAMARMIYDERTGLYYDDEKGIFVSKDGKESYTFPIFQPNPNEKIKNITFNKNESNGYDVYLVHYDFSKEEAELYTKETLLERDVKYEVIVKDDVIYSTDRRWWICVEIYSYTNAVPLDNGDLTGNFGWQWVLLSRQCESGEIAEPQPEEFDPTGSISGGGGNSGGWGGNSTNPPNTDPPSTSNPNSDETTILTATIVDLDNNSQQKTPCFELNKLTTNPTDTRVKNALTYLGTKTGESEEYGYSLTRNPNATAINNPTPVYASTGSYGNIYMPTGGNNIGSFHTHPIDTEDWIPMFSGKDISYLYFVAFYHNNNGQPKNYAEYILTLTVPEGTFAIKIKDYTKFRAFLNKRDFWSKDFDIPSLQNTYKKRNPTDDIKGFQKDLLTLLKDSDAGVGLYEADPGFGSWQELTLDLNNPNANPIKQPCYN
jgi:hypothetical protein